MNRVFLAIVCLLLMAGTNPEVSRSLASGSIGCSPAEIGISDETSMRGIHNFVAHCKGREYFCTYKYPAPIVCNERAGLTPEMIAQSREAQSVAMAAWKTSVLDRVQSAWKKPEEYKPSMTAKMGLKVDDAGELINMYWVTKSGNKAVDKSIKKAFENAEPYPIPPDLGEAFSGVEFEFPPIKQAN